MSISTQFLDAKAVQMQHNLETMVNQVVLDERF
jgi:hypothetical protein